MSATVPPDRSLLPQEFYFDGAVPPGKIWVGVPTSVDPSGKKLVLDLGGVAPGHGLPSLTLDFMVPGALPPNVVFTRASTATYTDASGTIQTAATNVPRWDYDPVTHALRGLLIEEARTNLTLSSADLGNAAWTSGSTGAPMVITSNNVIAPDGTLSAARIVMPAVIAGANATFVYQNVAINTVPTAFSIWLRGAVGGEIVNVCTSNFVVYSHITAVLTTTWQRFSFVATPTSFGQNFLIGTDMRDATQTPSPAQTFYAWGAQAETGAFPTSYIPTTAAAVTRAADVMSMPTNVSWYNQSFGTLFGEFIYLGQSAAGFGNMLVLTGANANTDLIGHYTSQGDGSPGNWISTNGVSAWVHGGGAMAAGIIRKSAFAYQPTTASSWINGTSIATAPVTGSLPTITNLVFIGAAAYQQMPTGYMRRVTYWPRVLTDAEMQQVTT